MPSFHRLYRYLYSLLCFLSIVGVIETVLVRGFLVYEPGSVFTAVWVGYAAVIVLYAAWVMWRLV